VSPLDQSDLKVRRRNLTDQVTELLQRYIVKNDLKPGEELPTEMELTQIFGVSRTVIREGLRTAAALGLVETESGKRSRVAALSADVLGHFFSNALRVDSEAVEELLQVREVLETYAVRLAARNRNEAQLDDLAAHLAEMDDALHAADNAAFVDADVSFHHTLAEMSGNSVLLHLLEALGTATRRSMASGLSARRSPEALGLVQKLHNQIRDAIANRDVDAATEAMREHFQTAIAALRAASEDA
jgi:DNA-binding FadR family transcriptional regulator